MIGLYTRGGWVINRPKWPKAGGGVKISEIVKGLDNIEVYGNREKEILGISYDSRNVSKECIFAALHGASDEGGKYIKDAVSRGAAAVLTDDKKAVSDDAVYLISGDVSDSLGRIASRFYNEPSKHMKIFAVTGTNGKTTITYLLEEIFKNAGIKSGIIGTIFYRFADIKVTAPTTTPQSSDLHELLSKMKQSGADAVAIEVSSHGLVQNRISGCDIDAAIFTNLTRDHLDYHKTMEEYKKSKFLLFEKFLAASSKKKKFSIINTDDSKGRELSKIVPGTVITYGIKSAAQIKASDIVMLKTGTVFFIKIDDRKIKIETDLLGRHNIYNILAAFACAYSQGISFEVISAALKKFNPVPGRFEAVTAGQPFTVIVDYAHTPDALGNLIYAARTIKHKKIITVFGCGGDRDRTKRPLMGELSGRLSDYTIITSDNPRTEVPERIILDVEIGLQRTKCGNYEVIVDRAEAIAKAISICNSDDILLIAGKGHEDYQIIGDKRIHFNDKETASKILSEKYGKKS